MRGKKNREEGEQTHTSSGLIGKIRQIKWFGPVGSSREVELAKEYSSHLNRSTKGEHYNGLRGVCDEEREADADRQEERERVRWDGGLLPCK